MKNIFAFLVLISLTTSSHSQFASDYSNYQEDVNDEIVSNTLHGNRIGTGQSVKLTEKGMLNMIISHRFGRLDGGAYELFGLDQATMRLGFDYGVTNRLAVGIGRNNFQKIYDFQIKYSAFIQNLNKSPVSITGYGSINYITLRNYFPENHNSLIDHTGITLSLMTSRKFGELLSLQINPVWHRNFYAPQLGKTADIFALGYGLSIRISKMIHLNSEYYYLISSPYSDIVSPLTFGLDIDTGGHIFQLLFSNSRGMTEKVYLTDTRNRWKDGEVFFGFNLIRFFYIN